MTSPSYLAVDLERQLAHWLGAAQTFCDAEEFASGLAWQSVEAYVGMPLRRQLAATVDELLAAGRTAAGLVRTAQTNPSVIPRAQQAVQAFRHRYTQVEVTLDFFGHAVNSRTSRSIRATLQTLDHLAVQSMEAVLRPLNLPVPPVLTYVDQGLGASVLRAGVRLWSPGTVNPVAAIKVVRHNVYRPTSLFHECGHQVAYLTRWTPSVAGAIGQVFAGDAELLAMWQPWSSEIVADVFALVHTGYASVAALYDVVGDSATILRWPIADPHPVGWIRTLLGCAMCRLVYGAGPWDGLERSVLLAHPLHMAEPQTAELLKRSQARLDQVAAACLTTRITGFGGRQIGSFVDPQRVSPASLAKFERDAGDSLWTSPHLRRTEGIRLVALSGLREAEHPERAAEWIDRARNWLTGLAIAA